MSAGFQSLHLWHISSCRASTSGVEIPTTVSAFPPAVHSISTFPTASSQEYPRSPSFSYTNLPGYTAIHFRSHFHSITCTHGLETAEQGSLWDISWSQGSEALSCCLAPTVGTLPSKMYVSACFTFNIWRQWARSHFKHDSCHIHNWKETKHFVQGMVK